MPLDVGFKLNLNPAALQEIKGALREGFEIGAAATQADAVELSPWITGNNRRSIDSEVKEEGGKPVATVFTQSGYGGYLEIGTTKRPATPYLKPAFDKNRDLFLQATRVALK